MDKNKNVMEDEHRLPGGTRLCVEVKKRPVHLVQRQQDEETSGQSSESRVGPRGPTRRPQSRTTVDTKTTKRDAVKERRAGGGRSLCSAVRRWIRVH